MVSQLGVDAIGFILSTDSPRRITQAGAEEIVEGLSSMKNMVSVVGVFVNEKIKTILKYYKNLKLDYVQLSGDEDKNFLRELKENLPGLKIIKSLRIGDKNKIYGNSEPADVRINDKIGSLGPYADFILLDTYKKNIYGGTGKTFNREVVKDYTGAVPIILSGGLEPGNVKEAVEIVKPFGVDASSRLEACPGKKDPEKVRQFVNTVRKVC